MTSPTLFNILHVLIVVLSTVTIGKISSILIHYSLHRVQAPKSAHLILVNLLWVALIWIATLVCLNILGLKDAFNLGAIGLGVAVFLVQGFVTSIVQGFIIIVEHDFDEGDYISISGLYEGTVTDIKLRLTFLINDKGQIISIPNSNIYNSGIIKGRPPIQGQPPIVPVDKPVNLIPTGNIVNFLRRKKQ